MATRCSRRCETCSRAPSLTRSQAHLRSLFHAVLALAVLASALAPRALFADDRTAFLIDRLRYPPGPGQSDDFRVRSQAALQLGRTNADAALQPLCNALSDPNDFVRQAVAASLLRLGRSGALQCLRDRLGVETSDAAKGQIQKAIDGLAAAGGGGGGGGGSGGAGALAHNPNAKYLVSLSRITNNTGRAGADVDRIVLGAIQDKLASIGNYEVAPAGQTPDVARAAMSSRHMKGYYFSISVDAFDYSGGNLRVRVKLAIFSYPGKSLMGEVPVSPVQSGVSPGDKSSEDNLMQMAAAHAVELFASSFP